MALRRRHHLPSCLLCRDFLTESNCEGNNEDGQTCCNTTSYQDHLLDEGKWKTRRQSVRFSGCGRERLRNRAREKGRERKTLAQSVITSGEIIMQMTLVMNWGHVMKFLYL